MALSRGYYSDILVTLGWIKSSRECGRKESERSFNWFDVKHVLDVAR